MSEQEIITQQHSSPMSKRGRSARYLTRLTGFIVGVVLVLVLAALGFWGTTALRKDPTVFGLKVLEQPTAVVPLALQRTAVTENELADISGVKIVYVAVTGGGGLVDLRYQILDPNLAAAVHDEDTPPILIDEATGLVVDQLLMGHLHSGDFNAGQTYYLIFENPGSIVQSGSKVSVLLGDAEVDHIIVK